jgi:hypothetical protein
MPDPITALGLAKTTSDIIKDALDFARKAKNSELAEKLVDLYGNFIELSDTNQQLRSEIQELKVEIAEFKKRPDIAAKLRLCTIKRFLFSERRRWEREWSILQCLLGCRWQVSSTVYGGYPRDLPILCYWSSQAIASSPSGYSSTSSGSSSGNRN